MIGVRLHVVPRGLYWGRSQQDLVASDPRYSPIDCSIHCLSSQLWKAKKCPDTLQIVPFRSVTTGFEAPCVCNNKFRFSGLSKSIFGLPCGTTIHVQRLKFLANQVLGPRTLVRNGAPRETRTPDPLITNQLLYISRIAVKYT